MKLVSFETAGVPGYGAVKDGRIVDLGRRHGEWPTLAAMLGGAEMERIAADVAGAEGEHALDAVTLLPPIPEPRKMFALGLNYKSHILEGGRDVPKYPMLFVRYPDSVVGHHQPILVPQASSKLDYEGEMAVVIAKDCRRVKARDAFDVIAGYSCYNEGSVRDFQRHTAQFLPGKTFWKSGSFGPWIVTQDEAPTPDDMVLTTRLNGEVMQNAGVDDLLFKVPELIEYITTICPLGPGDVIVTGTTEGVGCFRDPPIWLKKGDVCEVEVSGVGVLSNPIENEA